VHVRSRHGVVTARTRPSLLGLAATIALDATVRVDGQPWNDPKWRP
jgi:hypothetical protein